MKSLRTNVHCPYTQIDNYTQDIYYKKHLLDQTEKLQTKVLLSKEMSWQWVKLRKFPSTKKNSHLFFQREKLHLFPFLFFSSFRKIPISFSFQVFSPFWLFHQNFLQSFSPFSSFHQNFLPGFFTIWVFPSKVPSKFFHHFQFPIKIPFQEVFPSSWRLSRSFESEKSTEKHWVCTRSKLCSNFVIDSLLLFLVETFVVVVFLQKRNKTFFLIPKPHDLLNVFQVFWKRSGFLP